MTTRFLEITKLLKLSIEDLTKRLKNYKGNLYDREQLILNIAKTEGLYKRIIVDGALQIMPDGFGFIRYHNNNYKRSKLDVYVSPGQIKRFKLKNGHIIRGEVKLPHDKDGSFSLLDLMLVNGLSPEKSIDIIHFEDMTPLYPNKRIEISLDKDPHDFSERIVDIVTPIGLGQRALIVAPPRTGKTTILKKIANSISNKYICLVLLIDERPEEVTDMKRSLTKAKIISSTFDEKSERHVEIAETTINIAKRLVETGKDVIIMLDSITRLGRAYNSTTPSSGRTMSGGVDSQALRGVKKFFGAARNVEGEGSLTIIATALVDTGSKMDEVIFEEFKGTGNSEIHLDRNLSDKRVFPAINIVKSGTRKEELLLDPEELRRTTILRRLLLEMNAPNSIKSLKEKMTVYKTNTELLMSMKV